MRTDLFLIGDRPGFTPQIGRLVSMMEYARYTTVETVRGLSVTQLDHRQDERSNSIGAQLAHIAAVEVAYQASSLEGRDLHGEELDRWETALDLGPAAADEIRGFSLDHYLRDLSDVRERTLAAFRERNDDWLYEERPFSRGLPANHYFQWFHVFEDEINHRGQMRWLVKRLPPPAS